MKLFAILVFLVVVGLALATNNENEDVNEMMERNLEMSSPELESQNTREARHWGWGRRGWGFRGYGRYWG